jgi:hypothetical protein
LGLWAPLSGGPLELQYKSRARQVKFSGGGEGEKGVGKEHAIHISSLKFQIFRGWRGGGVGTRDSHSESNMSNFPGERGVRGGGTCKTLEGGPHTMAVQGPHKAKSGPV